MNPSEEIEKHYLNYCAPEDTVEGIYRYNYQIVRLKPSAANYKEQLHKLYQNPPKTHKQYFKDIENFFKITKIRTESDKRIDSTVVISLEPGSLKNPQDPVDAMHVRCVYCMVSILKISAKPCGHLYLCNACYNDIDVYEKFNYIRV
jgi:hypothetical protein